MTDQVRFSAKDVFTTFNALRDPVFGYIERISSGYFHQGKPPFSSYRGGAAFGVKRDGIIQTFSREIHPEFPDFWGDPKGSYAAYAAMKCVTALQEEADTVDTGEEFNFSRAVHAGAVVLYIQVYGAWISIAFSGYKSENDKDIAMEVLQKFFFPKKPVPKARAKKNFG
jgi:hypothetical protein